MSAHPFSKVVIKSINFIWHCKNVSYCFVELFRPPNQQKQNRPPPLRQEKIGKSVCASGWAQAIGHRAPSLQQPPPRRRFGAPSNHGARGVFYCETIKRLSIGTRGAAQPRYELFVGHPSKMDRLKI